MTRMPLIQTRPALVLLAIAAFQPALCLAQSDEISAETLMELARAYEELRKQNPELEERSAQEVADDLLAISRERRDRAPSTEAASVRSSEGSAAATARCMDGYVLDGKYRPAGQNVTVSEDLRDCDVEGCRAYEVSAISESTEPFDLSVSVVCST